MEEKEELEEKEKKEIANKIWDTPFASVNLQVLKKSQLVILIESILFRIFYENPEYYELDIKDILFEEKCWLIETLDPDFFERSKTDEKTS